jgi:hypothetical protein
VEVRYIEESREALCRFWIEVAYSRESEWSINVDKEGSDLKEVRLGCRMQGEEPHLVDIVKHERIPPGYYGGGKGAM